ncbi:MAG: XRE family transcriptional regulator [Gammaproteobacteria bacterium]|nr:XRE family transcriptional regulator [Gammaproteobacteria bacterium]
MIGERIQQARKAAGLSLRDLAELAEITAMAISKYERNESTPSSKVLLALSKALNVRTEYFFRQVSVELENVEHREHEKLPAKEEAKVYADVKEQLERWIELEEFIPSPWSVPFVLPEDLPRQIESFDEIEDVADKIRTEWQLGLNPIPVLIDTLEAKGIKVFITQYDGHKHFNGLSATVNGSPVVVVGKHWPGDRQRFTLAHELGHLVLNGRLNKDLDEELACHRFAGAFLAPQSKVKANLGNKRTWIEPRELMILKHEYGLSMGGWLYRARDLGILPNQHFGKLWGYFNKHGWKEQEPDPQFPQETARMFEQLVYHALAEDLVGESKAAELLGMSVSALHACRNMECSQDVVNQ